MSLSLKDLYYHPTLGGDDPSYNSDFEVAGEKINLSVRISSPLDSMPKNFFDWPEAKIVARYWTPACTDKMKEAVATQDKEVWRSFKMEELIGKTEYKQLLEELRRAKAKYEPQGLWIHGYSTPPVYFAEALGSLIQSKEADFSYQDKPEADLEDISMDTIQESPVHKAERINEPLTSAQDFSILKKCILCHSDKISPVKKEYIFGLIISNFIVCATCGATFKKSGDSSYKLTATRDHNDRVWNEYKGQTLSAREWVNIGNGGMSDTKQREADIQLWLTKISSGKVKINVIGAESPVLLKNGEEALCVLPGITLKEPRSVRKSSGSYGGPSFRVAKGVSIRLGRFGSTSESHQEIRDIDEGTIILTNEKLIFAGGLKTITVALNKVLQIDPFSDGIGLHREGREKTQYFLWRNNIASVKFSEEGREYSEPFTGVILKCIVDGAVRNV